jgi:hypothetical protein
MRAFEGLAAPCSVATPVGRLSTMPAYEINARVLTIVANDDGVGSRLLHRSIALRLCARESLPMQKETRRSGFLISIVK